MKLPGHGRGSNSRLLRGYGPLLGMIVAFLCMTLLAPTIAPERIGGAAGTSSHVGAGTGGTGEVGTGGAGADGAEIGPGSAGTPEVAGVEQCPGPQIEGDPYSPACRQWAGGDNGGATSPGVTGDTITVALRDTGGPYDIGAIVTQLTGERLSSGSVTRDDFIRTYETLIEYFNQRFQFYGRKLELAVYRGKGSLFDEMLGGGQSGANADAITTAKEVRAFADVSTEPPVYADALARQGVISTNPIYPSREFYAERAPYVWGVGPDCTKIVQYLVDFILKKLVDQPVVTGQHAGKPRKIGLTYPESPAYTQCGQAAQRLLREAGHPFADVRQYRLSLDGIPPDARDIAAAFANQGITTVLTASDPLLPYFMAATAQQSNWSPEWIETGIAFQDLDFAGQLYEPAQWKNAFGISLLGPTTPARSTYGYAAYRSVDSSTSPVELMVEAVYYQLYLLSIGVHLAGPELTPQTFQAGMRAYRPAQSVGPAGAWGFPEGDFTAPQDARIVWWDPSATSQYNNRSGAYRDDGKRYPAGGFPSGPLPFTPGR